MSVYTAVNSTGELIEISTELVLDDYSGPTECKSITLKIGRKQYKWDAETGNLLSVNLQPLAEERARA